MLEETIFPSSLDNLLILLLTQHPALKAICICTGTEPQTGFSNFIQSTGCKLLKFQYVKTYMKNIYTPKNPPNLKGFLHTCFYTTLHTTAKSNDILKYKLQALSENFFSSISQDQRHWFNHKIFI